MQQQQVGQSLIARHQTITSAESLTAGLFVATLAEVSGISAVLPGAFVTYAAAAKTKLVGVPAELITTYGVVSDQVARAMARGAQEKLATDWAISFTGVAGPDALEGHPAGTVYIGVVTPSGKTLAQRYQFQGDRQAVREASVAAGFDWLAVLLSEES
ncbi:nicotinamide-nucleotide amidohydrolase family protein [Weissella paramesenteroides]|uniref:nicotinamide-nucleotide amidohydrolase family protein n=1 Tax=Weissella paramesenteroides TaxID=1249 RepID=UPI00123ADC12|nr:nicotinamide-nucleotide amidohydrolase family protein [Weissella paramesenteroides]KAA8456427.1 nicotinamide-nucleotide amidohydrolase family protein [Weissella paramesenteroides]KAA8456629.1 nicotinamide-nucleotide amidohydrolase family protein [Weissella paramesenteroides]KAA8459049.1 nicotinamide-nucleotide amidohydrolase family protein [Weissella paramesenteroides]KAA8463455.1 nicotinamide-nucleotide amidohydrolase family protein [Weissella paramesenteroides]KAA8465506.1 nicotinamide-nu